MKKIVALALALVLLAALCLGGCAKKPAEQPAETKAPETAPTAAPEPAPGAAAWNTVTAGSLTVAISPDFAPMEFVDVSKSGQDQYVGFDVTLAKFIAEEMGLNLVVKPMSFDACQAAVQTGSVDMSISGYSWTTERNENFNLSDYYYAGDNETEQAIITVKEKEGALTKAEDFAGLTVGAQTASLQMSLCTSQLPETTVIKEFSDIGTAVEALRNGNIDALAVAKGNGDAIIANNDQLAFTGFEFEVAEEAENNVILLRKGTDELTAKVNEILAKAYAAGYYGPWYEDAKALAGIETSEEISYDDEGNAPADEPAPEPAPTPVETISAGSLTVAISPDFAPMEFVDVSKSGQDQYVGFDVTLAKFIAEEMGLNLVVKPMSFDACQAAVQTGSVDMSISGYSWTPERNENFNLSDYYYAGDNETEQVIITVKASEGKWVKAEDFAGLTVGAQTASLQMSLCTSQLPENTVIKEFSDIGTAVEALRNGNIDALAVAKGNGDAIIANNDALAFTGFEFEVSEEAENNVILLRKGADELTARVNEILAKAYAAGYYGPWYEDAKALAGIPTSEEISYDDEGNAPAE